MRRRRATQRGNGWPGVAALPTGSTSVVTHANMRLTAGHLDLTRLATILDEGKLSYTAVAERARLQPRTVRQLASGETPIDNVAVGTVRKIASALSLPVSALLEPDLAYPGDASLSRTARLPAAIREVMWRGAGRSPGRFRLPADGGAHRARACREADRAPRPTTWACCNASSPGSSRGETSRATSSWRRWSVDASLTRSR